jgi:PhnB protein
MFYQVYVRDADAAVDLYRRAFNAELLNRMAGADGLIVHAEMDVFGHILALSESSEAGGRGDSGNTMQFCIQFDPDEAAIVKAAYQALEEGATIYHPLGKCFYSECMADLIDRFGVRWCLFA